MKKQVILVGIVGLALAVAGTVLAQSAGKVSGDQVLANFGKGGPYGGAYTAGTFVVYSSEPAYMALLAKSAFSVQSTNATYTTTVAKAASAVQPTDATYTATVAKAASAIQVEGSSGTVVMKAGGKSITNTFITGLTDATTNVQIFINGQLTSWKANGTEL